MDWDTLQQIAGQLQALRDSSMREHGFDDPRTARLDEQMGVVMQTVMAIAEQAKRDRTMSGESCFVCYWMWTASRLA